MEEYLKFKSLLIKKFITEVLNFPKFYLTQSTNQYQHGTSRILNDKSREFAIKYGSSRYGNLQG